MPYPLPDWQDSPSTATHLSAANLNQINSAVNDLDTRMTGKVGSISAADSTVTIGGTAAAPTVKVNQANLTIAESQVTGLTADLAGKTDKAILAAKGDLYAASGPGMPARVGVGADGQVLTADSTQPAGVKWAAQTGGGISPSVLTTKGDLLAATGASTLTRLGVGSDGQVLTADSLSGGTPVTPTPMRQGSPAATATAAYNTTIAGADLQFTFQAQKRYDPLHLYVSVRPHHLTGFSVRCIAGEFQEP